MHLSLIDITRSLALNEFESIRKYLEWYTNLKSQPIYKCFEYMIAHYAMKEKQDDFEVMNEENLFFESSPCLNKSGNQGSCKDYCEWFDKITNSFTGKEILSLMR